MAVDIDTTSKKTVHTDLSRAVLAELAVLRGEGQFASNGSIVTRTGERTGRSPKDRFIVDEPSTSALLFENVIQGIHGNLLLFCEIRKFVYPDIPQLVPGGLPPE